MPPQEPGALTTLAPAGAPPPRGGARGRPHAATRPMRLIALTGYGQASDRERALEAGFDAHLVKPVKFDELARELAGA